MNDAKPDVASLPAHEAVLRGLLSRAYDDLRQAQGIVAEVTPRRHIAALEAAIAALAKPASGDGLPELVAEGLDYFDKAGDAGDKKYVAAIREHLRRLATPEQPGSSVQGEAVAEVFAAIEGPGFGVRVLWLKDAENFIGAKLYTTPPPAPSHESRFDAVIVLLNHLEDLMDKGVLAEDAIPVDMWNLAAGTAQPAPAAEQGESIARRIDRVVFDPMRVADKTHKERQPEARGVEGMVPSLPGNWPEDASHENGDYECKCIACGATFYGHKRRVVCKVCATPNPVRAEQPEGKALVTRESALEAIDHVEQHNGPGRASQARTMLAAAPAAPGVRVDGEWLADVRRCLEDVSTEMRSRGRGDERFQRLIQRMPAALAPDGGEGE